MEVAQHERLCLAEALAIYLHRQASLLKCLHMNSNTALDKDNGHLALNFHFNGSNQHSRCARLSV